MDEKPDPLSAEERRTILTQWYSGHEKEISVQKLRLRIADAIGGERGKAIRAEAEEIIESGVKAMAEIEAMLGELK